MFKDLLDAGYEAVDVYRVSSTIITASEVENRAHKKLLWFSSLLPRGQCEDAVQGATNAANSETVLACVGSSTLILAANLFSAEAAVESSNRACVHPSVSIKYEQAVEPSVNISLRARQCPAVGS